MCSLSQRIVRCVLNSNSTTCETSATLHVLHKTWFPCTTGCKTSLAIVPSIMHNVYMEHKWQIDLCSMQCNGLHTRSQMCNAKFLNFVFRYPAVVNYAPYPARGRRNYALSMLCTKRISRYSSRQVVLLCTNLLQCLRKKFEHAKCLG